MAENKSTDFFKGKGLISPPKEKLLEKQIGLEEIVERYKKGEKNAARDQILATCDNYLGHARELMAARGSSHPHLVWNLLHRVDEQLILIMPKEELAARVIDVKTAFDMTIKEDTVRKAWLGDKGKLDVAIADITGPGANMSQSRFVVKDALQYLDDFVDYGFWKLSMNNLMSVSSAVLLAAVMLVYYFVSDLRAGIPDGKMAPLSFAVLGLMGGYLSNLLTKEDFLFVWGGPFFRYLLYNLLARPIIGAVSALFFYLVEKSNLVFSIATAGSAAQTAGSNAPQGLPSIITINVNPANKGYVYVVLAIAIGFAGEKMLRQMMDQVLKRLEQKAEKTKDTGKGTEAGKAGGN